jgi:Cu(I)/Ag(I) efflux system membrane fusion protein/cobalt-zinc-cadmium efflux system membrane fusion protein
MKSVRWLAPLLAAIAAGAIGFWIGGRSPALPSTPPTSNAETLWTCSMHPQVLKDKPGACPICGMQLTPVRKESGAPGAASGERKIKYWWDPMMSPPYVSAKPGKSPMGMDLVAVYEDEVRAGPTVTIDPVLTQNIGIRTSPVEEGPLEFTILTVGYLREAETHQHDITLKMDGWIERLYADTEACS